MSEAEAGRYIPEVGRDDPRWALRGPWKTRPGREPGIARRHRNAAHPSPLARGGDVDQGSENELVPVAELRGRGDEREKRRVVIRSGKWVSGPAGSHPGTRPT